MSETQWDLGDLEQRLTDAEDIAKELGLEKYRSRIADIRIDVGLEESNDE